MKIVHFVAIVAAFACLIDGTDARLGIAGRKLEAIPDSSEIVVKKVIFKPGTIVVDKDAMFRMIVQVACSAETRQCQCPGGLVGNLSCDAEGEGWSDCSVNIDLPDISFDPDKGRSCVAEGTITAHEPGQFDLILRVYRVYSKDDRVLLWEEDLNLTAVGDHDSNED